MQAIGQNEGGLENFEKPREGCLIMSSGRRRATTNAAKAGKLSALEQMAKARQGGGRTAQFEVRARVDLFNFHPRATSPHSVRPNIADARHQVADEEDVYDEMDDESYKNLVKKRNEREDFVVDDGATDNGLLVLTNFATPVPRPTYSILTPCMPHGLCAIETALNCL